MFPLLHRSPPNALRFPALIHPSRSLLLIDLLAIPHPIIDLVGYGTDRETVLVVKLLAWKLGDCEF